MSVEGKTTPTYAENVLTFAGIPFERVRPQQSVAEIEEMLNEWELAHPRLTPKTRKPRKTAPHWHKRLNEMEDEAEAGVQAPAGLIYTSCGCPVNFWVPFAALERRCFICKRYRKRVE